MKKPLSIIFGTPKHGWLPVDIISEDYKFKIDASDVPVNPLELLCDAIFDLNMDGKSESSWHLEPAWVFLEFKKVDGNYDLTIATADNDNSGRQIERVFNGTFHDIIEPFINALALFHARTYDEKNWPTFDAKKINRLQRLTADKYRFS